MNELQPVCHEMRLVGVEGGDIDEIYCPTCGRRMRVEWTPEFKKTILEAGDEKAFHTVASYALSDGEAHSLNLIPTTATEPDDWRMEFWSELMRQVNLDRLPAEPTGSDDWRLEQWERLLEQMNFEACWK